MRFLKSKHKGSIGEFIGTLLAIIFMVIVLTSYINCYQIMNIKLKTIALSRKYLLVLEQHGTLSDDEIDVIIDKLEELGLTNNQVTINDGLETPVYYGNDVSIKITSDGTAKNLKLFKSLPLWDTTFQFSTYLPSISKAAR